MSIGGDLGVAQDLHRDAWVGIEFDEERGARVAGAVDRDAGHAALAQAGVGVADASNLSHA
jgi:hypothetical protein